MCILFCFMNVYMVLCIFISYLLYQKFFENRKYFFWVKVVVQNMGDINWGNFHFSAFSFNLYYTCFLILLFSNWLSSWKRETMSSYQQLVNLKINRFQWIYCCQNDIERIFLCSWIFYSILFLNKKTKNERKELCSLKRKLNFNYNKASISSYVFLKLRKL